MYFIFNGKDSRDFGITVLKQPEILTPQHRTWKTFIDGYDGAISSHLGYHPYEMSFEIALEGEENIDRVHKWLQGEGTFIRSDFPHKYINVYVQQGIQFEYTVEWLYVAVVTMVAYDPFWYPVETEWQGPFENNYMERGWESFRAKGMGSQVPSVEYAPEEVFEENYTPNELLNGDWRKGFENWSRRGSGSDINGGLTIVGKVTDFNHVFQEHKLEVGSEYYIYAIYTLPKPITIMNLGVTSNPRANYPKGRFEPVQNKTGVNQRTSARFKHEEEDRNFVGIFTQGLDNIKLKIHNISLINLTKIFGKGNEPSKEWCDKNIKYYANWEDLPDEEKPIKVVNGAAMKVDEIEEGMFEVTAYGDGGVILENNSEGEFVASIENKGPLMELENKALETIELERGDKGTYRIPTYRRLRIKGDEGHLKFKAATPYIIDGIKDINYEEEKCLKPFSTNKIVREGGV